MDKMLQCEQRLLQRRRAVSPSSVGGFFLPALIGNILGGTALFSLLAYAQVQREIE